MIAEDLTGMTERKLNARHSLDAGGWDGSVNAATHVLDAMPLLKRMVGL
ncbi:MAG: hypothetical protein QM704_03980 [Anaeromyxobacteraceae bacterium]